MATHKSSVKRARQDVVKNLRNRSYLSMVRSQVKALRVAIEGAEKGTQGEQEKISSLLVDAQSALAKAAAKGLLHKNNASRRVSRLSHRIAKLSQPAT